MISAVLLNTLHSPAVVVLLLHPFNDMAALRVSDLHLVL
jgi:hypothetical protein